MAAVLESTPDTRVIRDAVAALRQPAVDLLLKLVAEPSMLGDEASAQALVAQQFAQLGLRVDEFEIDEDRIRDHPGYSPSIVSYTTARSQPAKSSWCFAKSDFSASPWARSRSISRAAVLRRCSSSTVRAQKLDALELLIDLALRGHKRVSGLAEPVLLVDDFVSQPARLRLGARLFGRHGGELLFRLVQDGRLLVELLFVFAVLDHARS